jgi:Family of unknown function (DUF5752)
VAPFRFMDCAITTLALGKSAQNLRELRDRMTEVPQQSISHHFYEALLRPVFDDPEYRNDFAVWARRQLHDNLLAERLGALDPMEFESLETLRQEVIDIIEDRLAEVTFVPWAAPGHEFHFQRSQMIVLDTGHLAATPADLAARVPRLSTGSIFYHFIEGRRRPPLKVDDFSFWLAGWGPELEPEREAIAAIDYHLWSLTEMRALIGWALRRLPRDSGGRRDEPARRTRAEGARDDTAPRAADGTGRAVDEDAREARR